MISPEGKSAAILRWIFAGLFLVAGTLHFVIPQMYLEIMPPYIPAHHLLVSLSGVCEILGGLGLLFPRQIRSIAAWGLVALLIAVLPANIYMATNHAMFPRIPAWILWLRLPAQVPLIMWAMVYTRPRTTRIQLQG